MYHKSAGWTNKKSLICNHVFFLNRECSDVQKEEVTNWGPKGISLVLILLKLILKLVESHGHAMDVH